MPLQSLPSNNTSQRTDEVVDIIEKMPTRFGFSVTGIALFLLLSLLFFGWIIKYPDVLRGSVTISTRQAPVKLVANSTGILQLVYKNSGESVKENEYIAIIKNAAITKDVQLVDSLLKKFDIQNVNYKLHRHFFPESVSLGELSTKYFSLLNSLYQYLDYFEQKPYLKQKDILLNLSSSQQKTLQQSLDEFTRLKAKYQLAKSLYSKDSTLFVEGLISETEHERSRISLLTSEQEFKVRNKDIIAGQYQIEDASNKIQLVNIQHLDKERELEIMLVNTYYELQESIKQWENKYVFKPPVNGKVEFLSFLKDNDYLIQGQELFSILPEKNEMIGQVFLPSQGAGKLKIGQKVVIKLDDYPFTQYGSITGEVQSISQVTNEQVLRENKLHAYLVSVKLPEGLKTNFGSSLNIRFETKGVAEIITDDRRLIQRFFSNLKHKISP